MTFQVALVGTDGLIIGSDRKTLTQAPYLPVADTPFAQFQEQCKFVFNEDESVICACSGDQEAQRVARQIVIELDSTLNPVRWLAALDSLTERPNLQRRVQLIVVRKGYPNQASWVVIGASGYVSRIEERQCVGVNASACFLLNNFYKKCSVDDLKALALLTLDYGATEFPTGVGRAYDLLILREGKDKAEWERFEPSDGRVEKLRKSLEKSTELSIYGQY